MKSTGNKENGAKRVKRRRVLATTGAAVAGVGFVGTGTATHGQCQDGSGINGDDACDAYVIFKDQSLTDECDDDPNNRCSVIVQEAYLPCGGFIDIHDPDEYTDVFPAGVGIGATCYLEPGTYYDVCIDLYENNCSFGSCVRTFWDGKTCIEFDEEENPTEELVAMLHLDTDGDEEFTHYCGHVSEQDGRDHAYLCDSSPPPVRDTAQISPY